MDSSFIQEKAVTRLSLFLVLFAACVSNETKPGNKLPESESVDRTIHLVSTEHFFSSNQLKDKFSLVLTGQDVLNGEVKFRITTSKEELIYELDFESKALIGYGLASNSTNEQKEKYIIKRMEEFFKESNFIKPCIDTNEVYDKDYNGISLSLWNEIKNEPESIGFYYLLWEGDQSWITFAKKLKVTVKYRTCC